MCGAVEKASAHPPTAPGVGHKSSLAAAASNAYMLVYRRLGTPAPALSTLTSLLPEVCGGLGPGAPPG
jgi:hypothetical protein